MKIAYIAYGLLTPTRAHNLQTVNTINGLIDRSIDVTFVNPILGEGAQGERLSTWRQRQSASLPGRLNVPRSKNVLLPSADLFSLYTRLTWRGRYWALLLDRCIFAVRALRHVMRLAPDVVLTRDLVVCWIFLLCRPVLRVPIVYEAHTLEHVMFDAEVRKGGAEPRPDGRWPLQRSSDFAGYQNDDSFAGRCYKRALHHIENWTLRKANRVVTLTTALAESLERELATERPTVVCSGHDICDRPPASKCDLRRRLELPLDRRIAIYSGLSFNGKGLDLVFEVASYLPDDCVIVVLGGEPAGARDRNAVCREYGLATRLILLPRVDHEQVRQYIFAADIGLLLYPQTDYLARFSSPLKLFEYMACGLPVFATDLDALREVIVDGVNGILVRANSPEKVAAALTETLRCQPLLQRLGDNALLQSKKFRYADRAERLIQVLESCRMGATKRSQITSAAGSFGAISRGEGLD